PQRADYNIFGENQQPTVAVARLSEHPSLPLKTYDEFDYDPMHVLLNAFAKIAPQGEGAALQIIIEPRGSRHVTHYEKILRALRKGEKGATALNTPETMLGDLARDFGRTLFSSKPKDEQKAKEAETRQIEENKTTIEQIEKKIATPIVGATIRLAVSAKNSA